MRTLGFALALFVATWLGASTAVAAPYIWDFQARSTAVYGDPGQSLALANAGFAPGSLLTGHIEFDPSGYPNGLVDLDTDPNQAFYTQGLLKFRLDTPVTTFISSFAFSPGPSVSVVRSGSTIYYMIDTQAYDPGTAFAFRSAFGLELVDSSAPGITDLSFLTVPPLLSTLDPYNPMPGGPLTTSLLGNFTDQHSNSAGFTAELLSLTTPAPEPVASALVAVGVAALLVTRRRPSS